MHAPGIVPLLVILAIVLLLFGGKRIAELAKGLGTGVKNFKQAIKEDETEAVEEEAEEKPKPKIATKKPTAAKTKAAPKPRAKKTAEK